MQFPQCPSRGLLIILVCWLSVNDAVPVGSYPAGQVRSTTLSQPKAEITKTTVQSPLFTGTPKSINSRPNRSTDSTSHSSHINNQDDINKIHGGLTESHRNHLKIRRNPVKISNNDNNDSEIDSSEDYSSHESEQKDPEKWEIPQSKEEMPDKCVNEARRQNQTYTRSIPSNTSSINPADDFKIAGEAEAKKTSSVHIGEDIALCWIETTTIKEDPEFNPPKRLVIREFTISFENSASIPESYLECNKLEGEIAPGDEHTVRKSALHEVIDENTKRSREVNFTRVSNIGNIIIRQHKKVRCGVGAVVSKDIFEWPDGTDNPKKRVEIKVGPSIRDLGRASDDKPADCTTEGIPKRPQTDHSQSSTPDCISGEPCESSASCENGDCSRTATVSPCEDDDCSTRSLTEETVPTNYSSNSNELLSTGVTGGKTTTKPALKKLLSPLSHKPERDDYDSCPEYDTDCISRKTATVQPESDVKEPGTCSGEDCSGRSSDGFTREVPCDQNKDASCLCSGENCASKEQSTTEGTEGSVEITTKNGELCENNSEDCTCIGSSCSIHGSVESKVPEFGNKQTDKTTASSVLGTKRTTTESSAEPSDNRSPSQKDSGCSESGECSGSSQSYSDEGAEGIGKAGTTSSGKKSINGPSAEQNGGTEIPDVTGVTQLPGAIGDLSRTESVIPCDESGPEGCSTDVIGVTELPGAIRDAYRTESVIPCDGSGLEGCSADVIGVTELPGAIGDAYRTESVIPCDGSGPEGCSADVTGVTELPGAIGDAYRTESVIPCDGSGPEGCSTDVTGVTELLGTIGDASRTKPVIPCDGSGPEGCSTGIPDGINVSDEVPKETKEYSSPISGSSSFEIIKEWSQPSRSDSNESEISSSCAEGDEGCRSADSSNESVPVLKPFDITTDSASKGSETKTLSPTSEKPETVTNGLNDGVTGIPITITNEETRTVRSSTESMERVTSSDKELSSDKVSVMECSPGSERSGDCSEITAIPSSTHTDTCESSGNCRSTDGTSSSDETNEAMPNKATERTKTASICDDGDESCESPSSSSNGSEACEDGSTDCRSGSASSIPESCDSASGLCSSEKSDTEITTTTEATTKEFELFSTINGTVSTTAETRRSITPTTPLSSSVKGRHRLALRIKVLLEHIDENKQKEQLVQVERHLLLNERPSEHGNHSLTLQLQSLNNSMNLETLKAIFNCSALENLSRNLINLDKLSKDVINVKEVGQKAEGNVSLHKKTVDSSVEDSISRTDDDEQYDSNDRSSEDTSTRKKREIFIPVDITAKVKSITDPTKEKAILESLPGVQEDFQNGMDHVLTRISKELDGSAASAVNKTAESSSSKILKILSDPSDSRVHSKSSKRTSRVERAVSVRQLQNPVNGEEIERWSNERFVSAADGGQIRSLTEFRILRDYSEDSRRNPSGL